MRVTKPRPGEPIRLVETKGGPRYRVVLDTGVHADGRRRQVTRTLGTLREARDFVHSTRTEISRGTYVSPARLTFDALCDRWLASKRDVREVTAGGYRQALKPVRARIGKRTVQSLTRGDFDTVVQQLITEGGLRGVPLSRRSVVYSLGAVKQVMQYAVTEGLLVVNPAASVRPPRKQPGDTRPA